jgi:hypothetical protein
MTLQNKFQMSSNQNVWYHYQIESEFVLSVITSTISLLNKIINSTQNTLEYLDAAMSRSGLGWRNASAVAAASRNKADQAGSQQQ